MDLVRLGSETAKAGFANERDIADKFNNWKLDPEVKKWLSIMGYTFSEIISVRAKVISGYKADLNVVVFVEYKDCSDIQNISIKKANSNSDYNQVDKRWIDSYVALWDIPHEISRLLKIFSGEIRPMTLVKSGEITQKDYDSLRDKRRFFMDEFHPSDRDKLLDFFRNNKTLIVADILKGRGEFSADWFLVTKHNKDNDTTEWALADINKAMSIYSYGDVKVSPRGSIYIGNITVQRKGGDGGRDTANMLQFKIKPCLIFNYVK